MGIWTASWTWVDAEEKVGRETTSPAQPKPKLTRINRHPGRHLTPSLTIRLVGANQPRRGGRHGLEVDQTRSVRRIGGSTAPESRDELDLVGGLPRVGRGPVCESALPFVDLVTPVLSLGDCALLPVLRAGLDSLLFRHLGSASLVHLSLTRTTLPHCTRFTRLTFRSTHCSTIQSGSQTP